MAEPEKSVLVKVRCRKCGAELFVPVDDRDDREDTKVYLCSRCGLDWLSR